MLKTIENILSEVESGSKLRLDTERELDEEKEELEIKIEIENNEKNKKIKEKIEGELKKGNKIKKLEMVYKILKVIEEKGEELLEEGEKYERIIEKAKIKEKIENKELRKQLEVYEKRIEKKDEDIKEMFKYTRSLTSSEIGREGELEIEEYINSTFENVEIVDVSKRKGESDMWVKFYDYDCVMLIESKNKQRNEINDVEKYMRDVIENKREGKIDCGLYISLRDVSIPKKRKIFFEKVDDIEIGYISGVKNDPEKLKVMIMTMIYLSTTCKKEEIEDKDIYRKMNEHMVIMNSIEKNLESIEKISNNMKGLLTRQLYEINKLRKEINTEESNLYEYLKKNGKMMKSVLEQYKNIGNIKEKIMKERILEYKNKNDKYPTVEEVKKMGYSEELKKKNMSKIKSEIEGENRDGRIFVRRSELINRE